MWWEVAAPVTTYVAGVLIAYRLRYIKLYKNWSRWQAEDPEATLSWFGEYGMHYVRRNRTDFGTYVREGQRLLPPSIVALLWPAYWPVKGLIRFLRPAVKVPDYTKIRELEKLDEG